MYTIIKGTILTQPRLLEGELLFFLDSGERTVMVVRRKQEDQMRDIVFLCIGQEVVLCAYTDEDCVIADKIRITNCENRNYLLPTEENEEVLYGNTTIQGTDLGDPEI